MAIKNLQLINRATEVEDSRQRDHNDKVAQLLNSLLRNGSIFQSSTNPPAWSIIASGTTNYTAPDNSAFSWVNQQSATITAYMQTSVLNSGISPPASDSVTARVQASLTPPYTVTAALKFSVDVGTDLRCGLCWRESGSGKLVTFGTRIDAATGAVVVDVTKWTNPTTFSAHYLVGSPFSPVDPIWLQIQDDNTNRYARVSPNGHDFMGLHTVGRTNFLTANQVGFFTCSPAAGGQVIQAMLSWTNTTP